MLLGKPTSNMGVPWAELYKVAGDGWCQSLGPCYPHVRPDWGFGWFLVSAWPNPDYWGAVEEGNKRWDLSLLFWSFIYEWNYRTYNLLELMFSSQHNFPEDFTLLMLITCSYFPAVHLSKSAVQLVRSLTCWKTSGLLPAFCLYVLSVRRKAGDNTQVQRPCTYTTFPLLLRKHPKATTLSVLWVCCCRCLFPTSRLKKKELGPDVVP